MKIFHCHDIRWSLAIRLLQIQDLSKNIGCCFLAVSGYRHVGNGGTDRHEILHDGTYRSRMCLLPFGGGTYHDGNLQIPNFGLNFGHLTANISKTLTRSVTCQLHVEIYNSSMEVGPV